MTITYKTNVLPETAHVIALYENCGMPRPITDHERIEKIYANSNLVITAWDGDKLVGVSRSITDWAWSCYLADLAVNTEYKKSGIGRQLIALTKAALGEQTMLLLLSVPTAMEYYPKVGFDKVMNGFIINRAL